MADELELLLNCRETTLTSSLAYVIFSRPHRLALRYRSRLSNSRAAMADAAAPAGVFATSASIKQAVALLNSLPVARLPALLNRIASKATMRDEDAFSAEEQAQLCLGFELSLKDLTLLLDTLSYLIETTAYNQLSLKNLGRQLAMIGVGEEQAQVFAKTWSSKGPTIVTNLREGAFFNKRLESTNWQVDVRLGDDLHGRAAVPSALLDLNLVDGKTNEHLTLEFSHEELASFYDKLEVIQGQLDRMS